MKITWLGQAGLLFERDGVTVMVDPYLSNSVEKVNPANYRRAPVNESYFGITPEVMIFTHDHLDHYDPETAPRFLEKTDKRMTVLSPTSVWQKARALGGPHNYVEFNRLTEWTEYGFRFKAVRAVHSDPCAIGVIIEDLDTERVIYITGDTLYNYEIFADVSENVDVLFLPINGVGNNMNMTDAARFASFVGAAKVIPYHFGMFDSVDPTGFDCGGAVVPEIYREFII